MASAGRARGSAERNGGESHGPAFYYAAQVDGVHVLTDSETIRRVHRRLGDIANGSAANNYFPVNWPVDLHMGNLTKLKEPYVVRPDFNGTRYLLYIDESGDVYMENNSLRVFAIDQVRTVHFPNCRNSVLDGKIALKARPDDHKFVFIISDAIRCNGVDLIDRGLEDRLSCVQETILTPRLEASNAKDFDPKAEAFDVDIVPVGRAVDAAQFLAEEFKGNCISEMKSLVFHSKWEPYRSGTCRNLLQMGTCGSPGSELFKLRLKIQGDRRGNEIGYLYAWGPKRREVKLRCGDSLCTVDIDQETRKLNGTIVDCYVRDDRWIVKNARSDRLRPNAVDTVERKFDAMARPVSAETLKTFLANCQ